jgi:hypothetical protein
MSPGELSEAVTIAGDFVDLVEAWPVADFNLDEDKSEQVCRALLATAARLEATERVVAAAIRWGASHQPWPHDKAKPLDPREHPARAERDLLDAIAALDAGHGESGE